MHSRVFHLGISSFLHKYIIEARWEMETLIDLSWVHTEKGAKLRVQYGEPKFRFLLEAFTFPLGWNMVGRLAELRVGQSHALQVFPEKSQTS